MCAGTHRAGNALSTDAPVQARVHARVCEGAHRAGSAFGTHTGAVRNNALARAGTRAPWRMRA
eukprot:5138293-Alexandrium_andersonii.AAC.1